MKYLLKPAVLWLLVAVTAVLLLAQTQGPTPLTPPAPEGKSRTPVVLEHANSLQVAETGGIRMQELRGNVRITKDSLIVTCEYAVYYPDSGMLIFRQNVIFESPNRILMADEVRYNEITEEVYANGRVRVYQGDSLTATAQAARYFNRIEQGYLYNSVQLRYESRRVLLAGDQGYADHTRNYGRVTGHPVLTERDSTMRIVTRVRGDTIEYYGDERRARVLGNVNVDRDSLTATGINLDYYTKDRVAVLLGTPKALRGDKDVVGDTMKLYFEGEDLRRVEVIGHAVVTSPADSGFAEPRNRMEGKQMTLYIDSGAVREVLVEGTAIATYYIRENNQPRGKNITSGDRLHVFFDQGRMSRIRVEGGTEGTYTPQRLLSPSPPDTTQPSNANE